jgi:hypothetical protein
MRRAALLACLVAVGAASSAQAECWPFQEGVRRVHTAPPQELLDRLAILRRPKQAGDDPPFLAPSGTIAIDYVRRLGEGPHGRVYYLVPGKLTPRHLPARCFRGLTPRQRRNQRGIERRERRRKIGLGLLEADPRGGGGGGGYADLRDLMNNYVLGSDGGRHRANLHGMVPDGVASVTLRWHGLTVQRDVTVANNFWVTRAPRGSGQSGLPTTTIWRGPDGHVVKSFRQPF